MTEIIKTEKIEKTYEIGEMKIHALRGVTLTINEGEFVSIMGSSGSGKSTLMNIIGCLDVPTRGEYYLDGIDVSSLESDKMADIRNKKIGFVFQNFNLLNRISSLENVELPLIYNGTSNKSKNNFAREALIAVGLEGREDHLPTQLSGGQQQRVAIARAIVNKPNIILADEPTGNLDTSTSHEIMETFKKLNNEGKTIIMITHENDIASFANRIIKIKDGLIESDSSN